MELLRRTWDAVKQAEEIVYTRSSPAARNVSSRTKESLKVLLELHVTWNRLQIARELYLICERGNWDFQDEETRELAMALFAHPPNTKFDLEDCFAHLASTARLSTMATKFNKQLGFIYFSNNHEPNSNNK